MRLKGWGYAGLGGLLVGLSYLLYCQFYLVTHAMNGIFRAPAALVWIPAAKIDGQSLSYKEVVEMAHGIRAFGEVEKSKVAFDQALQLSVHRLYVKKLADEFDVKVTAEEVAAYPLTLEFLSEELAAAHWSEKEYRKYVIKPLLLAQRTASAFEASDTYQQAALERMESLRKKVAQSMSVADVAQNFSESASAVDRGDFGIMPVADVPEWLRPALLLEPGDISEVLSAPTQYWTVSLLEFYPSDTPELAAVHFRGFAINKQSLGQVINSDKLAQPAWVFVW
ncbi:MAG: peptidylprolyl isomerase [Patescibacteria group bacterium]